MSDADAALAASSAAATAIAAAGTAAVAAPSQWQLQLSQLLGVVVSGGSARQENKTNSEQSADSDAQLCTPGSRCTMIRVRRAVRLASLADPAPFCSGRCSLSISSHRIAAVVKVPQLLALLRSRSTVGVSLSMYSLELFSQSVAVFYHRVHGFPVSTYGENLTLGAGNVAILACFAAINRDPRAIVSLLFPLLLAPLQRYPSLLSLLQSLSIPINIAAKLPQLVINQQLIALLRARLALLHEQQRLLQQPALAAALVAQTPLQWPPVPKSSLAALPFALNLAGSTSRLFTTVTQLDGDAVMLAGFAISCALNAAILLQCRYIHSLQQQCTSMAGHVASLTTKLLQAHPPSCEQ